MSDRRPHASARVLGALAFCCVLGFSAPATAAAIDTASRPASAIQKRWTELKPSHTGSAFTVTPSTAAPYAAGSLNAAFLQDGLNAINYARFLAGLPDDVALDDTYGSRAQHGAVLLAASTFSHTPPKPADMPQAFYDLGYGATSSSNIGWGYSSLSQFNNGCLDDSDTSNIDRLGHRRWLLNPPLKKTGMGYASSRSDTFVFDWSRTEAVDYDAMKWPCAGYFPAEMFDANTAWSVTLNPAKYSWTAGRAGHTITLRRTRDGRTWTFTSADTGTSGEYFNFETSGYGVNNCFVFRPDPATVGDYLVGDVFDVTVTGGITLRSTGAPATVTYRTEFMSQAAPPAPDTTPPVTTSDARSDYVGSAYIRLSATDAGSGVAATYYSLDGAPGVAGSWVTVTATGTHTLSFWSTDQAGNVEDAHEATFTVATGTVVRTPTSITIGAAPTSVYLPKPFVLSGLLAPGLLHDPCGVEVRKPGSARWSYSSARLAYATTPAGGAAWWYRYTPKVRGTYYFQVRFAGDASRAGSLSRTIAVRVR